jgi:hypothetical protein
MENDKATAWLTLADADAVEQKVLDVLGKALLDYSTSSSDNLARLAIRIVDDYSFQMRMKGLLEPIVHQAISDGMRNNFKVEHYYEQYRREAGYRISYGQHVITQQNIKIGF